MLVNLVNEFWLGLDLDGVCCNLTQFIAEMLEEERGHQPGTYLGPEDWYFEDWGIIKPELGELIQRTARKGGFLYSSQMTGCSKTLHDLKQMHPDLRIRVITSRQFKDRELQRIVIQHTAEWLYSRNIPFDELCFTADKAGVGCDLYIDDSPDNIQSLLDAGKNVIVYGHPYNEHIDDNRVTRTTDWIDAGLQISLQVEDSK